MPRDAPNPVLVADQDVIFLQRHGWVEADDGVAGDGWTDHMRADEMREREAAGAHVPLLPTSCTPPVPASLCHRHYEPCYSTSTFQISFRAKKPFRLYYASWQLDIEILTTHMLNSGRIEQLQINYQLCPCGPQKKCTSVFR